MDDDMISALYCRSGVGSLVRPIVHTAGVDAQPDVKP
jgi:hypothetical protein